MISIRKSWYREYLACPDCGEYFHMESDIVQCSECGYNVTLSGTVGIKPKKPPLMSVRLPKVITNHPSEILKSIDINQPEVTYNGPSAIRDSRELMSEISRYLGDTGSVLDLGCGPRDQAGPVEHLGYKYVGIDYSNENADFLADAHSIPFKESTFDCVLSYAVLQHLHNPFIAIREIERVLKPGGVFIGTVSQGEPFQNSYFHLTPWGIISLMSSVTSFEIRRLWGSGDTLGSLARLGRYPRMIRQLIRIVDKIHITSPFLAPRKMKWPAKEKALDELYRAGGICFVVQKPGRNLSRHDN